jgi:hypothetical protein
MTHIASAAVAAGSTFGRDGAMFESLLGFVAQLSLVLWGVVMLTAVIRFVGIRIYRRGGTRTALVEAAAPGGVEPPAAVQAAMTVIDLVQPAAGQQPDVRLGLFGPTTVEKDAAAIQPAFEPVPAAFEGALATAATVNPSVEEVLHRVEAPVAVASPVQAPHPVARTRRAERRSAGHVHALAGNSTER